MDGYGTRLVQSLGDDHIAERAIQSRHLYHVKALISPVDVSCRVEKEIMMLTESVRINAIIMSKINK